MPRNRDYISPREIIGLCTSLDPNSNLVRAAKAGDLDEVDRIQIRADEIRADDAGLGLLFASLYASFHSGIDVMKALSEPSTLYVDPSNQDQQAIRFKPPV